MNLKLHLNCIRYRDVTWTNDARAQIIRNSKVSNSSFVGQGSLVNDTVDNSLGAVEALYCRGIAVFVNRLNSSFEVDCTSSCLFSRKDDRTVRVDQWRCRVRRVLLVSLFVFFLAFQKRDFSVNSLQRSWRFPFTEVRVFNFHAASFLFKTFHYREYSRSPNCYRWHAREQCLNFHCLTVCWLPWLLLASV